MDITGQSLNILFTQADIKFQQTLNTTPVWAPKISTTIPSSTSQNLYAWMDRIPVLRKWLGDRVVNSLNTHSRTVVNLPFELTDAILAEHIRHDQYGVFNYNLQAFAQQAAKWPDQQIASYLINNAAAAASAPVAGFDGKTLFATDHPTNGGDIAGGTPSGVSATQSNLFTSKPLTYENFVLVFEAMAAFKGADGQPLSSIPDTLVVPPQLWGKAKNILEGDLIAGVNGVDTAPQTNVYKGVCEVLMLPELSPMPTTWFLLNTKSVVKPLIWQQELAPRFTYLVSPSDLNVFMSRQFLYGVEAWGAPAESVWWLGAAGCATTYGA